MALLASLLLLSAASAGSFAINLMSEPDPGIASLGGTVELIYTIENAGDMTLYNIAVDGLGVDPDPISVLPAGEEIVVSGFYTVVEGDLIVTPTCQYVLSRATATAYNSKGRYVAMSIADNAFFVE
jgi:hypothetical protein